MALFELGDHLANDDNTPGPQHRLPPRSKTKQPIEEHYDDCGDDFTPITLPPDDDETTKLTHAFTHDDETTKQTQHYYDMTHDTPDNTFHSHYLKGSDYDFTEQPLPPHAVVRDVAQLIAFLQTKESTQSCRSC